MEWWREYSGVVDAKELAGGAGERHEQGMRFR
jgi:hypothetical protein